VMANLGQLATLINMQGGQGGGSAPSRVLVLRNMVQEEDTVDDGEYGDIVDDIREEMGKHGRLLTVLIPRKGDVGCGRVYLEYSDVAEAARARQETEGRLFANRTVHCDFMSDSQFARRQL
jgi:splicing factor U2AF subunit